MARAAAIASGTADITVVAGSGQLKGFSIREAAGTPALAVAHLRDGSASGAILATISLGASGSQTVWFAEDGVDYGTSLFFDRVSGTTEGCAYVRDN